VERRNRRGGSGEKEQERRERGGTGEAYRIELIRIETIDAADLQIDILAYSLSILAFSLHSTQHKRRHE
jgi:hypothetical protein